ncbi:Nn.00g002020.m01.CDS01 [Neocucurbitaria sp. VM-36]
MLGPSGLPKTPLRGQHSGRQTYYGHPRRKATKCGHDLHPSAPTHTPWCPACIASLTRARLDAAQRNLIAEGGLTPAKCMRDRRWNQARLKYEVAKKRLEAVRQEGQLRWEREQAWDGAHQRYDSSRAQAAAEFQSAAECQVCASMVASYSTSTPKIEDAKDVPWWERPGALVKHHILGTRSPLRLHARPRPHSPGPEGSQALRKIVKNLRASMHTADAQRRAWEARHRTESAVRQKYSLSEAFHFEPNFWESPISGLISLRTFQQIQETQRMAARRARGNAPRPKPPRSSLSHSELSEELQVDKDWVEIMKEKDDREELERQARKVGEEVGYLYFVGAIDDMEEWKEDYLRSDRQLVIRKPVPSSESSGSQDTDDASDFDEMDLDEL